MTVVDSAPARVLVVDDEEPIRRVLKRMLDKAGYECAVAANAQESRALLATTPYDVMLCDITMPGESGFDLLADINKRPERPAVIMVSAIDHPQAVGPAVEHGAYGYVTKPFSSNEILVGVASALRRLRAERENDGHRRRLEERVRERTATLQDALARLADADQALRGAHEEAIRRLANVAEWRDPCTGAHLHHLSAYAGRLAVVSGLDVEHSEIVRVASLLHDIGKVAIPDDVLLKPGPLTPDERRTMERHPVIGAEMLAGADSGLLRHGARIALTHHERWDGSGYPHGLAGDAIPVEGRIVAVADVYDALRSERPYKKAFSVERATEILLESRGSHLDAELVDLFLAEVVNVQEVTAHLP